MAFSNEATSNSIRNWVRNQILSHSETAEQNIKNHRQILQNIETAVGRQNSKIILEQTANLRARYDAQLFPLTVSVCATAVAECASLDQWFKQVEANATSNHPNYSNIIQAAQSFDRELQKLDLEIRVIKAKR
jgi:hypothetical protein